MTKKDFIECAKKRTLTDKIQYILIDFKKEAICRIMYHPEYHSYAYTKDIIDETGNHFSVFKGCGSNICITMELPALTFINLVGSFIKDEICTKDYHTELIICD